MLKRYERPVFALVYRMVRDRSLAEDLAQEAFIRAFKAISSYDQRYKFSSWVFKIANNHTIDHLRKRKLDTISIHESPHARAAQAEAQDWRTVTRSRQVEFEQGMDVTVRYGTVRSQPVHRRSGRSRHTLPYAPEIR